MPRIALVTDSSSDLTLDMCSKNQITLVPLTISFGEETYIDRYELSSAAFFSKLRMLNTIPKTCQPSPADFIRTYAQLLQDHDYIFSLHVSSKMSGTVQGASIAAQMVDPEAIRVIDTEAVSLITGLVLLEAAESIQAGATVSEVEDRIRFVMDNFGFYWTLDSLTYLEKNGRIGKAAAFLGTLLSTKPILSIHDGEISPVERVHGSRKALPRVLELMQSRMGEQGLQASSLIDAIVLHADDEARGRQWLDAVETTFNCRKTWLTECGPVVGSHAGPGTTAIAWCPAPH